MSIQVNIHEAKTHLSKLLERVMNGEKIIIAKSGKPIAQLVPLVQAPLQRLPGNDTGKIIIESNFDDPLPEFAENLE